MQRKVTGLDEVDVNNPVEGDMHVVASKSVFNTDLASQVAQRLRSRFRFLRNEWFRDPRQGMPYLGAMGEKGATQGQIDSIIRAAILTTPGVSGLDEYQTDFDAKTRTHAVDFVATLTDGTVFNSEDFGPFIVGG
jgi:hypothetical protein